MIDVLIVGAGPAGLSAAKTLSRFGAKVHIVDRHLNPGQKACGGGLTGASITSLKDYDDCRFGSFCELRVKNTAITSNVPYMTVVDRMKWQKRQIEELSDAGCSIDLKTRFLGFKDHLARTDKGEVRFEVLIGADGAASRLRSQLGLEWGCRLRAWQLSFPASLARGATWASVPTVWFRPELFGSGYGWSFPAGEEVRLGCGASELSVSKKKLKRAFGVFLEELRVNPDSGRLKTGTIGCGYVGHRFGHVFLAGDAAGLASPITGEGIAAAVVSGSEVAREIIDKSYRSKVIADLSVRHRRTFDFIAHASMGRWLYRSAKYLFRMPGLGHLALRKYG